MHPLSPIPYITKVCEMTASKAVTSACVGVMLFLFGSDIQALVIALSMLMLDTFTGTVAAIIRSRKGLDKITSKKAWGIIPKFIAIGAAFIVGNWLQIFEPALGGVLKSGIAGIIIYVEATSILENVQKIDSRYSFGKIISKLKNYEQD